MIAIVPSKHARLSETLLAKGATVLRMISARPLSIDDIWEHSRNSDPEVRLASFDELVLTIDLLFMLGLVQYWGFDDAPDTP